MSQCIMEDIANQTSAFYIMTSPILNNRSGICTTATQNRGGFRHLLVFFLKTTQFLSILAHMLKTGLYLCVDAPQASHFYSHTE
jgi:hypothetical protein